MLHHYPPLFFVFELLKPLNMPAEQMLKQSKSIDSFVLKKVSVCDVRSTGDIRLSHSEHHIHTPVVSVGTFRKSCKQLPTNQANQIS